MRGRANTLVGFWRSVINSVGWESSSSIFPPYFGLFTTYLLLSHYLIDNGFQWLINPNSVKTRIQLEPQVYNKGMIGGFRQVIQNEGAGALLTGLGPTVAGYFLQGAFKFGGYELFKQQSINYLGLETASANRTAVYLGSSALAEFFADIALCPLEATRIRLVSQPTFATGLLSGFTKILKNEGVGAFYSGFGPILFKQVPYTMAKFVVYERVAEAAYKVVDKESIGNSGQTAVNLGSGLIAGFAAAFVSQPADTMLSKINKTP